jgi:hypothetical protein
MLLRSEDTETPITRLKRSGQVNFQGPAYVIFPIYVDRIYTLTSLLLLYISTRKLTKS